MFSRSNSLLLIISFNLDFNSLFSIFSMVMVIINFIISKVLVLSKNDANDFPLIDCTPSALI